jgi:hypothetical protein
MSSIYLDESGFTGTDLLSIEQPYFVVSSLVLDDATIAAWLPVLTQATRAAEPKFSQMVKSPRGRAGIITFCQLLDQNQLKMRFQLVNKRYALLGKLLDCVVEPFYYEHGRDFYFEGHNLSLLNALHYASEPHPELKSAVLSALLSLCREPSVESLVELADRVTALSAASKDLQLLCVPILDAIRWRRTAGVDDLDRTVLALQVAAVVSLVRGWNQELTGSLIVIADQSKELNESLELLIAFANPELPEVKELAAGQEIGLPLRIQEARLADSHTTPGVQLADVAAGLVAHAAMAMTDPSRRIDGFSDKVLQMVTVWPRLFQIVPEPKFTPQALGRVGFDGSRIIDASAEALMRSRAP